MHPTNVLLTALLDPWGRPFVLTLGRSILHTDHHTTAPAAPRQKCPYLDTVNRAYLDFDFEKVRVLLGEMDAKMAP